MTGIIITIKNRSEYVFHLFESLKRADLSDCIIVIVDDGSTDLLIPKMISGFEIEGVEIFHTRYHTSQGVKKAIRTGIDFILHRCDDFMILDGDTMVRSDFLSQLRKLPTDSIATGFHCSMLKHDGSPRHPILIETDNYYIKESVGGANMMFSKDIYLRIIEPALFKNGNWDHEACKSLRIQNKGVYCLKESVVQHLGVNSAMGHHNYEAADEADDFYLHKLPNVTLLGASSDYVGLKKSMLNCTKFIEFGEVKILSHLNKPGVTKIEQIKSKAEYNKFILKNTTDYVDTDFVLIVQPDSWIVNPSAYSEEFLQYDYIGARWNWYKDEKVVGNGGFSLRSKRLLDILKNDPKIQPVLDDIIKNYEEDHVICRLYRDYLIETYDVKFAPPDVADKFSSEFYAVMPPNNRYKGSFGFHGFGNVDFTQSGLPTPAPHKAIKYGLITPTDAKNLEKSIEHVSSKKQNSEITIVEIGVRDGASARGMKEYCDIMEIKLNYIGIDNQNDMRVAVPFSGARLILKRSDEAYSDVQKADIIIVDGSHSLKCTVLDWFLYKDKLNPGGHMIFHDTGKQIKPFTDYQGEGDKNNSDNWIACRKALTNLGMYSHPEMNGFKIFVDESDLKMHTGGYSIFEKLL